MYSFEMIMSRHTSKAWLQFITVVLQTSLKQRKIGTTICTINFDESLGLQRFCAVGKI